MNLKKFVLLLLVCLTPLTAVYAQSDNTEAVPAPAPQPTELDLPVDESIKVTVEPVQVSNLVDRVMETATVSVKCPTALSAQVFVVPVDAPYGGRALEKPRLIGSDNKPADGLKVFAVVRKSAAPNTPVRSRTVDFAMGGARYDAPPLPPQ
jgi:hypothetical protein